MNEILVKCPHCKGYGMENFHSDLAACVCYLCGDTTKKVRGSGEVTLEVSEKYLAEKQQEVEQRALRRAMVAPPCLPKLPLPISIARDKLRKLVEACVKYGEFTLSSGKTSDFYFDGRLITLSQEGMKLLAKVICGMIDAFGQPVTAVGGPTMGADPIAAAVAMTSSETWDAFIVRKEAKGHGTGKQIEGPPLGPDSNVIVVEDVVTSGSSVIRAVEAIRATGATVVRCIPLLDREEGAAEAFQKAGVDLSPVFLRSELSKNE